MHTAFEQKIALFHTAKEVKAVAVDQGYSNGGPRSTIRTAKTLLADRDWLL